MQEDQYRYMVPRRIDDPPKFLFWDFDVFMVFMICASVGLLTGFAIVGFPGGIFAAGMYQKTKSGKTRGYARHLLYWYLPFNTGFKRIPPSGNRFYQGLLGRVQAAVRYDPKTPFTPITSDNSRRHSRP